jgi:hypothetical protein
MWQLAESIECFLEDQAFSPSFDLAPPPPLSSFSRQLARPATHEERQLATGREWGSLGDGQIIRRESLVLYKSFNTLSAARNKITKMVATRNIRNYI